MEKIYQSIENEFDIEEIIQVIIIWFYRKCLKCEKILFFWKGMLYPNVYSIDKGNELIEHLGLEKNFVMEFDVNLMEKVGIPETLMLSGPYASH
eukprot:UN26035